MKATTRYILLVFLLATVVGCNTSRKQVLASGSQVELRSYQTRTYDTDDKIRVLRAVMATLQDLGFVIEKADDVVGVVTATKLRGYALSISVSVRPTGKQMTVRANAQYNLRAVEEPGPYQSFFTSLDKGLFLDDNLYAGSVATQTTSENSSTGVTPKKPDDVFAYYGEAEQEITDGTYNKNLWARALVYVQGDEQKRKAKYIEFRAMELYAAEAMSLSTSTKSIRPVATSQTAVNRQPAAPVTPDIPVDISGTYRSDITGSGSWSLGKFPNIEVILKQNKGEISGTFSGTRSGEIEGILNGERIKFKWFVTAGRTESGRGEWKLANDGINWNGKWRSSRGNQGNWNLAKIE
jgi:hypothetical protein